MPEIPHLPDWPHVSRPVSNGHIKVFADDFGVEEVLGFEPDGVGEHLYLLIEKRNMNTQGLLDLLARQMQLRPSEVSCSGLKDRRAVTRQWISLHTEKEPPPRMLQRDGLQLLQRTRHRSKLRRGTHQANRFDIVIRDISDPQDVAQRIVRIQQEGVPNYFGAQRFGNRGSNLARAYQLFAGASRMSRDQRSLCLSAARSFLFNQVLAARVDAGNWNEGLPGEVMMLDGSNSFFKSEVVDELLNKRLAVFDIHPSAPLWGRGRLPSERVALALESQIIARYSGLAEGLEAFGLKQQRRATRLVPKALSYDFLAEDVLRLNFELPRGAFATTVVRELITIPSNLGSSVDHPIKQVTL